MKKLRLIQSVLLPILVAMLFGTGTQLVRAQEQSALLADAVQNQQWKQVETLLGQKADLDAAQADGMTALHWAVFHSKTDLVKKFIAAGANVNAHNRYGVSVLYIACLNGHGDIVEHLLKHGADARHEMRGGETLLMTASRTGKVKPVKLLLTEDVEIDAKDRKGQTALMWASAAGNVEVVDALIKAGADYRTLLKSGFTPLFFAVREGKSEVVLRLLEEELDVNDPMQIERRSGKGPRAGMTPLMLAVENGHFELAAKLLELGANPNENRTGYTPLHALTWIRKPIRGDGDPPPIGSGKMSSLEFARKLLEQGADVNARHGKHSAGKQRLNKTDATPFFLAAETGDIPYLNLLLELGADPTLKNEENTTPLLAAAGVGIISNGEETAGTEEEAIATVELLLKRGADINAVDNRKMTAMHGAAYKSWTKLIPFLAKHGADVKIWNQKNQFNRTPLEIAEGHRPGNFRPSPETQTALENVLQAEQ